MGDTRNYLGDMRNYLGDTRNYLGDTLDADGRNDSAVARVRVSTHFQNWRSKVTFHGRTRGNC